MELTSAVLLNVMGERCCRWYSVGNLKPVILKRKADQNFPIAVVRWFSGKQQRVPFINNPTTSTANISIKFGGRETISRLQQVS